MIKPENKKELNNRENIHYFVTCFYDRLLIDKQLKHFFNGIIQQNKLNNHLEIITNFWSDILLETNSYGRNAMKPHLELNLTMPFSPSHFERWLFHFNATLSEGFTGDKVEIAKTRALSIATVMKIKMLEQ